MKRIWKKLAALALSAALLLPAVPAARAEEPAEPSGDLMSFAGQVSGMIQEYGLESEGEAGLLDLDLAERFATARLIVKAAGEIDPLNAVSVAEGFRDLHVLQFADPADAAAAFAVYETMEGVEYVQPDGIVTLDAESGPSPKGGFADGEAEAEEAESEAEEDSVELLADPDFLSWGYGFGGEVMNETGDYSWYEYGINMADFQAWAKKKARSDVVVAVLDSGVMDDHEFLKGYVLKDKGYDFINNDNWANADHDHGTHVAGTIVDGTQALGDVKILPVKVLDEGGSGSDVQVSLGILYAAEQNVDVINMSLGGEGYSYMMREAIDVAVESGVTVVVSAGNDSMDACDYSPACFDNVICVAATDSYGELADYSNYGDVVDVSAPGTGIYSSIPYDPADPAAERYTYMNGTSMATPHVAAVAAILLSVEPNLTPAEVELRLEAACTTEINDYYYDREVYFPMLLDTLELTGSSVQGISISREAASICVGQELQLTASTFPKKQTVSWSSSNSSVASVSGGKVTAHEEGFTTITATYKNFSASCSVWVEALDITMPDALTLPVSGSTRVNAVAEGLTPQPELTWSVADPDIAEIYVFMEDGSDWPVENIPNGATPNGVEIRGLKAGTTTVSASFGGVTESFTVNVVNLGSWFDADGDEHYISNLDELDEFSWAVSYGAEDFFTGHTVYLKNNLNMAGKTDYEPISGFNGTFDGQGYTVSNLTFTDAEYGYIGFFGYADEDAVIRDLTVSVDISCIGDGESDVAGLVASNDGLIENCHVSGTISAPACSAVGGIAGASSGVIENCTNAAGITGHNAVAGIAGEGSGSISNCSNTADITVSGWNAGGIAGYYGGDVTDCTNSGDLYGEDWHIGGVVGYHYDGTVSGCSNSGAVTGVDRTGGVVGQTDGDVLGCDNSGFVCDLPEFDWGESFGGVVGYCNMGWLEDCGNTAQISTDTYYVGGILGAGYGAAVVDCRNEGSLVTGGSYVGGVVGGMLEDQYSGYAPMSLIAGCSNEARVSAAYNTAGGIVGSGSEATLEYCWNSGNVTCGEGSMAGGIAGSLFNTQSAVRDCTNNGDVNGSNYVGGIVGDFEPNWNSYGLAQLYNCVNYGAVTAGTGYSYAGGIAAYLEDAEIRNCLNEGSVFAGQYAGGLVGYVSGYEDSLLENCVMRGAVSSDNYAGLICGNPGNGYYGNALYVTNCYLEPNGSKFGQNGSNAVESNISGFHYDSASGVCTLVTPVKADGKTFNDLQGALNAVAMAAHEDDGLDLAFWMVMSDSGSYWLEQVYGLAVKSEARGDYAYAGTLDWDVFSIDSGNDIELIAARYNGGRMTAANTVDWSDGYLLKADLSRGSGSEYRVFGVDVKTFTPAAGFVKLP